MKFVVSIGLGLVLGCLGCTSDSPAPAQGPVKSSLWQHDLTGALAEAKKTRRPLLVDFGAQWCKPCKRMHAEVFVAPEIVSVLKKHFIPVEVDATDMTPAIGRLISRYGVQTLPTIVFLSPDGQMLKQHTRVGFQPVSELSESLRAVLRDSKIP